MTTVNIVDTTLRDGHQCLWATRMPTVMMLPVAEILDGIGFDAIEVMGAVQFDACVRYLGEDPWARLRALKKRIRTPMQALLRSKCALGFELQADDVNRLWIERLSANGIDRFVAFDGLHDMDNLADGLRHAKSLGAYTIGWLIYSESPVHTDALYAAKACEFIERGAVDALMIEDTSGILTPERVRTLVPALKVVIGDRPLGLHTHNLIGLGQLAYLEGVAQGVDHLYTCIAPVADGNAPPALQTTMGNLRYRGFAVPLNDVLVHEAGRYFEEAARAAGNPLGAPQDFDAANFGHQIPGGVLSNLASQLEAAGLGDRLDAVLAECARVRAELGWPIMVTPFSQLVGVQATLNILEGERYRRVPDEVKKYALGYYGKLLAPVDPDVLDRIVTNGSQTIALQPATREPEVSGLRRQYPGASEDELLLRQAFPGDKVDAMSSDFSAPITGAVDGSLVNLVEQASRRSGLGRLQVRKGDLRFEMRW